ncbi:MAG: oligosaccharide flippase family protein [Lachnospiraceae bacterium]|nr:oligosaccharide flippase family protein [Lachnospiraceae bacterium]
MKKKKSAVSGFLTYFYGNFIVLLLGFVQTPLATRLMSTNEYGRTGMFETAVSCIYIFAILGMDQAFIRYYYRKDADRQSLLRQCLLPSLGIVSFLICIYLIFAPQVNHYLFERSGPDITALVILYTVISVFERFLFLDVRMEQNGKLYSNINITQKVLNILLIVVAFRFLGNDFRVVLYAMTLSWGSTTLFLAIRYYLRQKRDKGRQRGTVRFSQRELMRYGFPFILILLMEWLLSSCDRVALRTWANYEELGIYSAAMKIMVLLITFKNTFLAYWSPVAMEKYENEEEESTKAFFRKAYNLIRFFCSGLAIGLILFRKVVVLLLGQSYRGADRVIPFLTLMPIYAMMFEITVQGIKFQKKNMYLNLASVLAIVSNVAGNALLVPIFGGIGAAMTTGLSYLIYFAVGSFFSERVYRVGYDYLRTGLEAALLIGCAASGAFMENYLVSLAVCLISTVLICILERDSIGLIFDYLKNLRHRKAGKQEQSGEM